MYPSISLRSPAEVISAVPSLLGFHPHNSLVLLFLSPDTDSLQCTVRIDLDSAQHEVLRVVHELTARLGSQRLLLIAYPQSLAAWIDSAAEDGNRAALSSQRAAMSRSIDPPRHPADNGPAPSG